MGVTKLSAYSLALLSFVLSAAQAMRYANDWAVVMSEEYTPSEINDLAEKHGFRNLGEVRNISGHYS